MESEEREPSKFTKIQLIHLLLNNYIQAGAAFPGAYSENLSPKPALVLTEKTCVSDAVCAKLRAASSRVAPWKMILAIIGSLKGVKRMER